MTIRPVALALLFGSSAALAFEPTKIGQWGSLYLDDLSPILAKSAQLKQEGHCGAFGEKQETGRHSLLRHALSRRMEESRRHARRALYLRFQGQISSHRRHRSRHGPRRPGLRGSQ